MVRVIKGAEDLCDDDTLDLEEGEWLIAQEFVLHGAHLYKIKAGTMGEAVEMIEDDMDVLPNETIIFKTEILGYKESGDKYDS